MSYLSVLYVLSFPLALVVLVRRLNICIELDELTNIISYIVSDNKILISILILRRGALSNQGLKIT